MSIIIDVVSALILAIIAFALGWIIRGATKKTYGILYVVSWDDGTTETLLELDSEPSTLDDRQEVLLQVHKTERITRR